MGRRASFPSAPWAELPTAEQRVAYRAIAGATRAVLNGGAPRPPLQAGRDRDVAALGRAAFLSGMGPLLGYWIETDELEAAPPAARLLAEHLAHGRRRAAQLDAALGEALDTLRRRGIVPVLLKGTHTGRRYFPEPGTRPRADIDLLVTPAEVERARAALREGGFVEFRRTRRPARSEWAHRHSPQAVTSFELDHADNPWSVDLHTTLERLYFRGRRAGFTREVATGTEEWAAAGRPVRVLSQPLLAASLALHAGYEVHTLRLVRLVELALVIRQDTARGSLDWDALYGLLERTGTQRFVYPAVALTERLAPGTVDTALLQVLAAHATARMRRVIEALAADGMRLTRRSLDDKLMWAQGPVELAFNLSDVIWPSDEAIGLAARGQLYLRRLRLLLSGDADRRAVPAGQRETRPS